MSQKITMLKKKHSSNKNDYQGDIYDSIGKMYLSNMPSAPQYGFSKQDKQKAKMIITKDLLKLKNTGLFSPGPKYDTRCTDRYIYQQDLTVKIGTSVRPRLNSVQYEHFNKKDTDYEPFESDNTRRYTQPRPIIGKEQRFLLDKSNLGPGPIYLPNEKQEYHSSPKYPFGLKLKEMAFIANKSETPQSVGPASYIVNLTQNTNTYSNGNKWTFTKGPKFGSDLDRKQNKNQTFDTKSVSIGPQVQSKKITQPSYSIGQTKRENTRHYFKQDMVKIPQRLNMTHVY